MCWSWKARAFAFAKVYRSRTHRPDWLKSKEVAQFFNSGWLTFLLTFTDDFEEQLQERIGIRLVSCASSNVLPLEVIGKIGPRKAVIVTNAISRELACVDQAADGDRINLQKRCYFLSSH